MTVSAQNSYISYTGNGSTSAYSFPYKVYSSTSIKVYTVVIATGVETLQTAGGSGTYDYSISVASDNNSATITLSNNLPTTHKVFITRILPLSQDLDVVEGDAFPAASFEQQLDKLTLKVQQHEEQLGRTPKYRQSTGLRSTGTIFPSAATNSDNAGKMIVYDSNGTALETSTFTLSGVTASDTELNILDGCTLTTAELNQFDGFTIADEDDMSSNSATKLSTQQSIKAYVDSQIATEDTIAELNDTNIGSLASGHILIYDGSDSWDNKAVSGDVTISSTGAVTIANNAVETAMINADAVTGAKIADDAIDSEHYTDGSIDTAHIGDLQVTTAKIAADAITGAKLADDAVDSEHYTDGSIDTAHIGDLQVTTAKIAADAITGAKIADDAINSEHYTDGSIDTAHIADDQVTTAKIAADAITSAEIADDAISEEHLDPTVISGLTDTTIASGDHLMFFDATDSALKKVDAGELGVGTSLTEVVGDTSPQLGGDLDVNGQDIVSTSNADIDIIPNGTGDINLGADTVQVGDNNANATITTQGTGDLTLNTNNGTNSGSIVIADGANNDISLTPNGSGDVIIDGLKYPQADGSANQVLKTDGSGQLSFTTPSSGKIKQITHATDATLYAISITNSTSDHAGTIAYTITPSSTSHKVMIHFTIPQVKHAQHAGLRVRLYRDIGGGGYAHVSGLDGTAASSRQGALFGNYDTNGDGNRAATTITGTIVDSPNTTSQVSYKFYFGAGDGATTVYVNRTQNDTDNNYTHRTRTHVTLVEFE